MFNLEEGKNFKKVNEFGVSYDLINLSLGEKYPIRIYDLNDLEVTGAFKDKAEDYWYVCLDFDGLAVAQPISAKTLAQRLLVGELISKQIVKGLEEYMNSGN